jgi:hypothetical protein
MTWEWACRESRDGDLVEFFAKSPLREEGLEIERPCNHPGETEL